MELQRMGGNPTQQPQRGFALANLPEPSQRLTLGKNQSHRLSGDQRWATIACESGRVWITQERDLKDYLLDSGEVFLVTMPGRVAIRALQNSTISISQGIRPKPFKGSFRESVFK